MVVPPRERITTAGRAAIGVQLCSFLLVTVAMFTSSWLQAETRAYGTSVDRIGLWWQCFRSYTVNKDIHQQRFFVGCRWIFDRFTAGYEDVRDEFSAAFFLATQTFFTLAFMGSLLGMMLSFSLILCPGEDFEKYVLQGAFITQYVAFGCGLLAVTIFGTMAPLEGWMPHPDHNLLSWSYALAVLGAVTALVAAILFHVEAGVQQRKRSYRDVHQTEMSLQTKA